MIDSSLDIFVNYSVEKHRFKKRIKIRHFCRSCTDSFSNYIFVQIFTKFYKKCQVSNNSVMNVHLLDLMSPNCLNSVV